MNAADAPTPTFWLKSEKHGITGPFTKREARKIVNTNADLEFWARRGEDEAWQDAATRLAPKDDSVRTVAAGVLFFAALAGVAFGVAAWVEHMQKQGREDTMKEAFARAYERAEVNLPPEERAERQRLEQIR